MILAIILVDWTRFCRVLRSEVIVVARRDHVAAARLTGFSHWQTVRREIIPATIPLLITLLSLEAGIAVVVEAILAFVGLGVRSDQIAWGQMIADSRDAIYQAPWNLLAPTLSIFVTVAGFNLLGDGPPTHARRAPARGSRQLSGEQPSIVLAAQALTLTLTRKDAALTVLRHIDFTVRQGQVLGLVGESGAGKSMLGRTIAQLLPPGFAVTGGTLAFMGDDLVTMPARRRRFLLGPRHRLHPAGNPCRR